VFIIDWLILLIAVSVVRFAMRLFREYFNFSSANAKNILIMGAGDAGEYFLRGIKYNKKLNYAVVGFLDDDTNKHGRKIHGVEILGTSKDMVSLAKKYKVSEILVAIPSIDNALFNNIMEICQKNDIVCKKMSELELW
jgi:FlaA1/EpsC-like NDP-sugar epimerase